ncbi:MAG: hypothetical protein R3F17_01435 [Planctomycetota bacterium]
MEIRKSNNQLRTNRAAETQAPGPKPHAQSLQESKQATARAMEALQDAEEAARPGQRDTLELSASAQRRIDGDLRGESLRASLVQELKDAYQSGSLNSQERMEQAARRLLGDAS